MVKILCSNTPRPEGSADKKKDRPENEKVDISLVLQGFSMGNVDISLVLEGFMT
jgi:hypothetical protein